MKYDSMKYISYKLWEYKVGQYLLFAKSGFTDWVTEQAEDDLVKLFGLEEVFGDGEKNKRTGS